MLHGLGPYLAGSIMLLTVCGPSGSACDVHLSQPPPVRAAVSDHPFEHAPLTDREERNLIVFAHMYGYVRYFHAADEAVVINGERLLHGGVKTVLLAEGDSQLAFALEAVMQPAAPTCRAWVGPIDAYPRLQLNIPDRGRLQGIRGWVHRGPGRISPPGSMYSSEMDYETMERSHEPERIPRFGIGPTEEIVPGFSIRVPTAVLLDDVGTVPRWEGLQAWAYMEDIENQTPKPVRLARDWSPEPSERSTRLACVIEVWNVFRHFYPYLADVPGLDLNEVLRDALKRAATDETSTEFLFTLRRLVSYFNDGQSVITCSDIDESAVLPLEWDWIDDRLVVTAVSEALGDTLPVGSIVGSIGGREVESAGCVAAAEECVSAATADARRYRGLAMLRRGAPASTVQLDITDDQGSNRSVRITRVPLPEAPTEGRPATICELEPGVVYIDLTRATNAEISARLALLQAADGIVFDARGLTVEARPDCLRYLADEVLHSDRLLLPVFTWAEQQEVTYEESSWTLEPSAPRLSATTAFLIDERTAGPCETVLGMVEAYELGALVGQRTAGCSGSLHTLTLPGGYEVTWTATMVLRRDKGRHYGIGIEPTVPVTRTLAGVQAGRDEMLETAVRLVKASDGG